MSTITVIGYGSLLCPDSAHRTIPDLENFRQVKVPGYRRVFNKVGVAFFRLYPNEARDPYIGSCSTQHDPSSTLIATAFECDHRSFEELYRREHRFRWIEVDINEGDGSRRRGRMCTEYNDNDYRLNKCVTEEEYHERVGQYYQGKLWRQDLWPFARYLHHCLNAAHKLGPEAYENFLTSSYLANGHTNIRDFLTQHPEYLPEEDSEYGNS